MLKRDFNKRLNACRDKSKKLIDINKINALAEDLKTEMALHIIKNRGPVLQELITPKIDNSWLSSMGYMYRTLGKKSGFTFVHTSEHYIQ